MPKDPNAVLDYSFDWDEWLTEPVDLIASYAIAVTGGLTVVSDSRDDGVVSVFVSGGTRGGVASIRCRVVTIGGRTDDRTIYLQMRER
jgi:hypothetical protein